MELNVAARLLEKILGKDGSFILKDPNIKDVFEA
jgi:hypothetical protein